MTDPTRYIARVIRRHWIITRPAVGIFQEQGYTDYEAAAIEIVAFLRRTNRLVETQETPGP